MPFSFCVLQVEGVARCLQAHPSMLARFVLKCELDTGKVTAVEEGCQVVHWRGSVACGVPAVSSVSSLPRQIIMNFLKSSVLLSSLENLS